MGKHFFGKFQPNMLVPGLTAGLIIGITDVSLEISLAALIFSGVLTPYVAYGIGFILFGALAFLSLGALTSSIPGTMTIPQDTPAAILALIAAGVVANMTASSTLEATFTTVVVAIILTTLCIVHTLWPFQIKRFCALHPLSCCRRIPGWDRLAAGFGQFQRDDGYVHHRGQFYGSLPDRNPVSLAPRFGLCPDVTPDFAS